MNILKQVTRDLFKKEHVRFVKKTVKQAHAYNRFIVHAWFRDMEYATDVPSLAGKGYKSVVERGFMYKERIAVNPLKRNNIEAELFHG